MKQLTSSILSRFSASRCLAGVGLAASLVLTAGCSEDVDSDAIRTHGMYARFTAEATGNGSTELKAELRVGGANGTFVKLSPGDELVASTGGKSKKMGGIDDRKRYRTTFDTDEGGTEFQIAFNRKEDESAPNSKVTLPEPFALSLAEEQSDEVERGNSVEIEWTPKGKGKIQWEIDGDCIWNESGEVNDSGSWKIPASAIRVKSLDEGETCEVTVELKRVRRGSIDVNFEEGGVFEATQVREVSFTSTPAPEELEEDGEDDDNQNHGGDKN